MLPFTFPMITTSHGRELYEFLKNSSGRENMNGDYSTSPDWFYISPPSGSSYLLARIVIQVMDIEEIRANWYGDEKSNRLLNGFSLYLEKPSGVVNLSGSDPIRTTADWASRCYDIKLENWGSGASFVHARWSFFKSGRLLRLEAGHRFGVELKDNFSHLIRHTIMVQGVVL